MCVYEIAVISLLLTDLLAKFLLSFTIVRIFYFHSTATTDNENIVFDQVIT